MSDAGPYRPNVAILLRNASGEILICERADSPGAWQCPQGGICEGESPEEAIAREVREEIGLPEDAYRIRYRRAPCRYTFPRGVKKGIFIGQEQTWFLADLIREDVRIDLGTHNPEFRAFRWIEPTDFDILWLPSMKWEVYRSVFLDCFGISIRASISYDARPQ